MAVKTIGGALQYVGLSSDTKPTDAPPGSTFWELTVATGEVRKWVYTGSAWGVTVEGDDVNVNLIAPRVLTGNISIDEAAAVWTTAQAVLTITPAAGSPVRDAYLDIDLAKAATGFAAQYAAQTITFQVQRKVDGTNWRGEAAQTAISGTNAASREIRIPLGMIGVTESVRLVASLSAENGGAVVSTLPYAFSYLSADQPTLA